ncbi:MAG: DNA-binding protein [Methanobacterium sp.]|nr:DNA-binding protein [Methanobacterium sp.]
MIVKRLLPGQDLKKSLEEIRDNKGLKSGVILCLVGSLDEAVLRMADGNKKTIKEPLESGSATGTIATNGVLQEHGT